MLAVNPVIETSCVVLKSVSSTLVDKDVLLVPYETFALTVSLTPLMVTVAVVDVTLTLTAPILDAVVSDTLNHHRYLFTLLLASKTLNVKLYPFSTFKFLNLSVCPMQILPLLVIVMLVCVLLKEEKHETASEATVILVTNIPTVWFAQVVHFVPVPLDAGVVTLTQGALESFTNAIALKCGT